MNKTCYQTILAITTCVLIASACSKVEDTSSNYRSQASEYINSLQTRSHSEETNHNNKAVKLKEITAKDISTVLVKNLKGSLIKDLTNYSLKTISENGSSVLHSVNFDSGGWALVASRDLQENTILAYGEEGSFDPEVIESPEIALWLKITKASLKAFFKQADKEYEQQLYSLASIDTEDETRGAESFSYDDPYVWVRFDLGKQESTDTTILNHLTITKWGPGFPWNYKCPTINGIKRDFGPGAVAVSQLLYYLHFTLGKPNGCFHSVDTSYTWHDDGGFYTSSLIRTDYQSPSNRWNDMATTNPNINCLNTQYVGNLMIDVADRMSTRFYTGYSFDYFSSSVLSYYNITTSPVSYTLTGALSQLDNALPVLIQATDTSANYNNHRIHMWLIDGYRKVETISDHQYKWVTMPPDSLCYYNNIDYDYVFTESEMQQFYPNVVENEVVHIPAIEYYKVEFLMNWGYDGAHNNDYFSYYPIFWYINNNHYDNITSIHYGFH